MAGIVSWPLMRRILPLALGVVVVIATVTTVGAEPFIDGIAEISPGAIVAAVPLTALATAAAAWRWRVIAQSMGLPLRWTSAVAAYYRSQFLNTVLPGGILGDAHRAYLHGRGSGDVALAARAVAAERGAGQIVQFVLVAVVLLSLGLTSTLRGMVWIAAAVALVVVVAFGVLLLIPRGRRMLRHELSLAGRIFTSRRTSLTVVASSVVVVGSHAATFIVACLVTGVYASPSDLIALALIALTAASVPFNIGGWGPREAASASAFLMLGLGAGAGLAASAAFGVLTMIAVLPGAVVLLADRVAAGRSTHRTLKEKAA
jgi:uncharacterized membrane protein YbhN (UPF0104 family)